MKAYALAKALMKVVAEHGDHEVFDSELLPVDRITVEGVPPQMDLEDVAVATGDLPTTTRIVLSDR